MRNASNLKATFVGSQVNINFLALDFDLTIVDIHTGGRWNGSIDELVGRIGPVFGHLIRAAHSAGLHIAIVTFSPQVGHISRVVEKAFPQVYEHIVVRIKILFWGCVCRILNGLLNMNVTCIGKRSRPHLALRRKRNDSGEATLYGKCCGRDFTKRQLQCRHTTMHYITH